MRNISTRPSATKHSLTTLTPLAHFNHSKNCGRKIPNRTGNVPEPIISHSRSPNLASTIAPPSGEAQ
jgi:hypothetical protein